MKCPKCGYNSFEIHDTCKKCANDLTGYKNTHGLKSVVLPLEARTELAEKLRAETAQEVHDAVADVPSDMFSFDLPEHEAPAADSPGTQSDPFNFGDEPAAPSFGGGFSFNDDQKSAQAKAEEEAFASLLESSPQAPAAAAPAAAADPGDDLSNFSWDDTPEDTPGSAAKPSDDFNDLFGDTDEDTKK